MPRSTTVAAMFLPAVLSFTLSGPARAQQTPAPADTSAPADALAADAGTPAAAADQTAGAVPVATDIPARQTAGEELVVTGSRIRRKDLTTPAPVTVITHEQFQASGKATIGDFLQTLPEQGNAPNFQLN